jgi:chemotaxis protein methyltransferase CheR
VGIVLPPGKAMLVYSRLAPLVRDSGCQTFAAYVMRIREDTAERTRAICALTTNHTFFYRESHHFEHFAREIRPRLIEQLERGGRVRMWSAGCSSGEEVWSLVMTLLGPDRNAGLQLARRDIRVLASDIATHAITKAQAARYRQEDLNPVPEPCAAPGPCPTARRPPSPRKPRRSCASATSTCWGTGPWPAPST